MTKDPDSNNIVKKSSDSNTVHVAVGVIKNKQNQFLISKRLNHLHQGGLWEFPGGKVEKNESVYDALCRELDEELAIQVVKAEPLIKITHTYSDKSVLLDVWLVEEFTGSATSQQQQPIKWVLSKDLSQYEFPAANQGIISSLSLPPYYAITGDFKDKEDFHERLQHCLQSGITLIQLRVKNSTEEELDELLKLSIPLCKKFKAKLLVNTTVNIIKKYNIDGIHLDSKNLLSCHRRPISKDKLLAASVHNVDELNQAMKIEVDFIVISPVLDTTSHPGANTLGWRELENLISVSSIPVFALGGMKRDLLSKAKQAGAQGIAAISEFWI